MKPENHTAKLPAIEDAATLMSDFESRIPSDQVVIDADANTCTLKYAYPYEINLDTIPDEAALLRWALHLCEKNWMDTERLHEVVTVIGAHKGFTLHD